MLTVSESHPITKDAHSEDTGILGLAESLSTFKPEFVIPDAMLDAAPPVTDPLYSQYIHGAHMAARRRLRPAIQPHKFSVEHGRPMDTTDMIFGEIHIGEMPYLSSPIVEMMRDEMPDAILAADRGGRMLGLAVSGVWAQRYGRIGLPTIDGAIHFGHVSKRNSDQSNELVIRNFLCSSGTTAEMAQRKAENDDRPIKIMMLDDWINEGTTVGRVQSTIESQFPDQDVEFMLGTLRGTRHRQIKHAVGDEQREHAKGRWTDDSQQIGVDYLASDEVTPIVVKSIGSKELRERLRVAITEQIMPSPYVTNADRRRVAWLLRTLGFGK